VALFCFFLYENYTNNDIFCTIKYVFKELFFAQLNMYLRNLKTEEWIQNNLLQRMNGKWKVIGFFVQTN
jgi:hypothetical protein